MLGKDVVCRSPASDFPGGPVVECLPASAGDERLIPVPGRFHGLQGNSARVPQLLKPVLLQLVLPNKRSHPVRSPSTTARELPLFTATREGLHAATKT